ncbi:MAG TPA: DMT family transporter [Rhizomicrobium sp.]|jgi:drug/metabolite transporter (DMT)-like permease|nr:DMT family transporter [Rhizomicrobium sp.]
MAQTVDQPAGATRIYDTKAMVAIAISLVLWGSAFAGIRAALAGYPPGELVLLRFLIASASLAVWALISKMPMPLARDLPGMAALGLLGIAGYQIALTFGQQTITAGAAVLIITLTPVCMALFGTILLGERLTLLGWLGTLISFAGIALVSFGESGGVKWSPGVTLVLLATLCTSLFFVLQRPYLKRYSPFQMTAIGIWAGTALMAVIWLPGLVAAVRHAPPAATMAIVYLGVLPGALAYVTWAYALSRVPASLLGSSLYLEPPIAIAIAFVWLGELPASLTILGGVIAIGGVVISSLWGKVSA